MSIKGISHITFIVRDLDLMSTFLCQGLDGEQVYDSTKKNFSISKERFYLVGGIWIAAMEGEPPDQRSYRHLAFEVDAADIPVYESRLRKIGAEIKPSRSRVDGEGQSLYFYDFDNHLFELHSGTLNQRLAKYDEVTG